MMKEEYKTIILSDCYYTPARDKRQSFDLVIPQGLNSNAGLVMCIYGGGWVMGDKSEYHNNLIKLCREKGVAAAALNYRYVSETTGFDDELDDISSALAAIKAEGEKRGIVFDRVLLNGISAGGHLALLYAYSRKDTAPVKPVCVVSLCGPSDFEYEFYYSRENAVTKEAGPDYFREIIGRGIGRSFAADEIDDVRPALKKRSPVNYVDRNTVPTVFGHGDRDDIVPLRNAIELDKKLTECGVEHSFVPFPDSGHPCENKESMKKLMDLFFDCVNRYIVR